MEPYQEASQAIRSRGEVPARLLQNAVGVAAGIGSAMAGGGIISRVLPFLSKYVPENLARKGLEQIDKRFGTFIDQAKQSGKSFDEIREFIKSKTQEDSKTSSSNKTKGIIEQYSPELHQFLDQEIKKGRTVHQAGAIAQLEGKFSNVIKKMEKDHKAPFSALLESVFGGSTSTGHPQTQESSAENLQQPTGIGPGTQQLMGLLQQLKQARGIQ